MPDPAATLSRLGVFGCEAARHLGALTVDGNAGACSFLHPAAGAPNPLTARPSPSPLRHPLALPLRCPLALPFPLPTPPPPPLPRARSRPRSTPTPSSPRLRAYHAAPPEPCRSCPLFARLPRGCQVVSPRARRLRARSRVPASALRRARRLIDRAPPGDGCPRTPRAGVLLVLHAGGSIVLIGAATHHALQMRHYLARRFHREALEKTYAKVVAVAYVRTPSRLGALLYPSYRVHVRAYRSTGGPRVRRALRRQGGLRLAHPDGRRRAGRARAHAASRPRRRRSRACTRR